MKGMIVIINKDRLRNMSESYDIFLNETQLNQLEIYANFLVEYNEKVNLTAIVDDEGIEIKHFLDCLLFAKDERVKGKICDVGTGAGFPGIVVKILKPEIDLYMIEPTGKRCTFLKLALDRIGITGTVINERAEEAARKGYSEKYDVVTARAVANLSILMEYCLPLAKVSGYFISMKAEATKEIQDAKSASQKLKARFIEEISYTLPDGSKRSLAVYKKENKTPEIYPRNGGKIKKSPL